MDFVVVLPSHQQQLLHRQASRRTSIVTDFEFDCGIELAGNLVSEQLLREVTSAVYNLAPSAIVACQQISSEQPTHCRR